MSANWGKRAWTIALPLSACASLYLGSSTISRAAAAVPASDTELEEIIVTATKRSERIQDIPVSVTAFTGKQLSEMGADTLVDYAREVPSLTFAATVGYYLH